MVPINSNRRVRLLKELKLGSKMLRVKKGFFKSTILITLVAVLVGCSTSGKKTSKSSNELSGQSNEKKSQLEAIDFKKAYIAAEDRLKKVVKDAKESGENSVRYLATNLFLKANEAARQGDYNSSALILKYVLELTPNDSYVALKYAVDLIRIGNVTDALELLELFEPRSGEYEEKYLMLIAGIYTSFQKHDRAEKVYKELVKSYPKNIDACVFLAKSYFENNLEAARKPSSKDKLDSNKKNRGKLAKSTLKSCAKNNPNSGVFSYYEGKMYLKDNKVQIAEKSFKKSLSIEPTFYQSAVGLGIIYEDQGKLAKAEKVYDDLLTEWPSNRVILDRMVQNLLAQEKYKKVLGFAQQLANLDPTDLNLKVKLGILHTDQGNYKKAISVFEEIIKEVPDSDKVLYYLGAIYQEMGNYHKSIENFSKISAESALFFDSSVQITSMLSSLALGNDPSRKSGRSPSSDERESYEERLLNFVEDRGQKDERLMVELNVLKGQYYELNNQLDETIKALESVKNHKEFTNSQRYYLATIYDRTKYYKESIREAKKIIEEDPKNAHAYNFIGYSFLERSGDFDQAFTFIQKALEIAPEDAYIRDSMGWYYYKIGEFEKSLGQLKKAFSLVDNDRIIVQHLGEVYLALKKYESARVYLEKALKLSKSDEEREEIENVLQSLKAMDKSMDRLSEGKKRLPASR